ncbi:Unknown protein sequence [Pseudomonas syringae pv. syringae]|nr:Unknown protein sequence [Pseudomonas syringae pv. syringae]
MGTRAQVDDGIGTGALYTGQKRRHAQKKARSVGRARGIQLPLYVE